MNPTTTTAAAAAAASTVQLVHHWDELTHHHKHHLHLIDQLCSPSEAQYSLNDDDDDHSENTTATATATAAALEDPFLAMKRDMEQFYHDYWAQINHDRSSTNRSSRSDIDGEIMASMDGLQRLKGVCRDLMAGTHHCAHLLSDLQQQYNSTVDRMVSLRRDCERLVQERDQLVKLSDALASRLSHFVYDRDREDEMYEVLLEREINLDEVEVISHMMHKLDDSIRFLSNHMNFRESKAYLNKYRLLQTRALANMRDFVVESMKQAAAESQQRVLQQQQQQRSISTSNVKQLERSDSQLSHDAITSVSNEDPNIVVGTEEEEEGEEAASVSDISAARNSFDAQQHRWDRESTVSSMHTDHLRSLFTDVDANGSDEYASSSIVEPLHLITALYIEFRAALESLRPILQEIEMRATSHEYSPLLLDCFNCYALQRQQMQQETIKLTIQKLVLSEDIVALVRYGCPFIIHVTMQEYQLFCHLFNSELMLPNFRTLLDGFFQIMYDGLHTLLLSQRHHPQQEDFGDLDRLCKLVEILRTDILMEEVKRRGAAVMWFEPTLHRMIQDVQERVIFRASNFIDERIRSFKPTTEDLNYPEKLSMLRKEAGADVDGIFTDVFVKQWYPTMETTVALLTKLHRSVETSVFEALAQETIAQCTNSFINASKQISEKQSVMDGELFLVKHLLGLQKQLLPFRLGVYRPSSSSPEQSQVPSSDASSAYDFSSLRGGISRFLRGQASFRVQDIIYEIMSPSKPKFTHSARDSRRDIEAQLKRACESLILNATRMALDPMMSFIKRAAIDRKIKDDAHKDNTIITVAMCVEVFKEVQKSVDETIVKVHQKMELYLNNPAARSDLCRSVEAGMVEVYEQFVSFVNNHFADDQQGLQQVTTEIHSVPEFISRLQSTHTTAVHKEPQSTVGDTVSTEEGASITTLES